jgi:outer membrane protein assembly factor BamB
MAALTFEGTIVWTNREVAHYSRHGLGASPIVYGDLVIMAYDGSNRVKTAGQWPNNSEEERLGWQIPWDKAQIVALNAGTGERVWTGKRGMSRVAHATPLVFRDKDQDVLLSVAGDVIQAFNPRSGNRLWSVYAQGEGLVPSPVVGKGMIFAASGFEKTTLRGIRLLRHDGGSQPEIAWEQKKSVPTQASLIYVEPFLYAITDGGIAGCFAPETGNIIWQERIGGNHCSSPISAERRIYFHSEAGETTVIAAGPEFKVLARNPLQERCQASMAASQGQIFIRGDRHIYCIANSTLGR